MEAPAALWIKTMATRREAAYAGAMQAFRRFLRTALPFLASYSAGIVASLFVGQDASLWYASIAKPPFALPFALYPLLWVVAWGIASLACAVVWLHESPEEHHSAWVRFYFLHLLASGGWIIFYLGFHTVFFAFIDSFAYFFVVMGLAISGYGIDARTRYLLLPYLGWVAYLLYLTLGAWILN